MIEQVPSLRCYPKDDDEFAADVTTACLTVGLRIDAVRDALRARYPNLRIAVQAPLASLPDEGPVWYCYRDGSLMGRGADEAASGAAADGTKD